MPNYLREQSTGELVRNTFQIYRRHFLIVVPIYALINLPTAILTTFLPDSLSRMATYGLDLLFVTPLAVACISVLLWDVCMGNTPSVSRAFRKVMSAGGLRVLGVNLLMVLALSTGFLLLVVPMLVAFAWFMLVVPVAMLEELSARRAMRRSRQLGKGHYLRNLGVLLGIYGVVMALHVLGVGLVGVIAMPMWPVASDAWILELTAALAKCLTGPIFTISAILIYFDMRARKEAHGFSMMGQDLMR
jgi:hypothetical protein